MNFDISEESVTALYCAVIGTMTLLMLVLGSSLSASIEDEDDIYSS